MGYGLFSTEKIFKKFRGNIWSNKRLKAAPKNFWLKEIFAGGVGMMELRRKAVLHSLFLFVLALIPFGLYQLYQHHDATVKRYMDGSVCSHDFNIENAYNESVVQEEGSSGGQRNQNDYADPDNKAFYDAAEEDAANNLSGERIEFQDIFSSLIAANQALVTNKEKPLFCAPAFTSAQRFGLYDSYWAATKQRIKQDLTVCRRDFPADVLVYYSQVYRCH
jgi:hypothetical protein